MKLDMPRAINQSNQLSDQAASLRRLQSSLLLFQRGINSSWRGIEMKPANQVIDDYADRLIRLAADLDSISRDMLKEAEASKKEEDAYGY